MSGIAVKLGSFDEDVRFMGLEDLDNLIDSGSDIPPDLLPLTASLVKDTSLSVQNRALRSYANLSRRVPPETLARLLFNAGLNRNQEGLALVRLCQKAGGRLGFPLVEWVGTHAVFEIQEGCDAVYEYAVRHQLSAAEAEKLTVFYLEGRDQPPAYSHGFDLLAITLPLVSRAFWKTHVYPLVSQRLENPAYLGLVSKIAQHERAFDFDLSGLLASSEDDNNVETALRILATFVQHGYSRLGEVDIVRYLHYKRDDYDGYDYDEYEGQSDGWGEGMESDDFFEDEDDGHESAERIRIAAAGLIGSTADARHTGELAAALARETADSVRAVIYAALEVVGALGSGDSADAGALELNGEIEKDVRRAPRNEAKLYGFGLLARMKRWAVFEALLRVELAAYGAVNVAALVTAIEAVDFTRLTEDEAARRSLLLLLEHADAPEALALFPLLKAVRLGAALGLVLSAAEKTDVEEQVGRDVWVAAAGCAVALLATDGAQGATTDPSDLHDAAARLSRECARSLPHIPKTSLSTLLSIIVPSSAASAVFCALVALLGTPTAEPETAAAYAALLRLPLPLTEVLAPMLSHAGANAVKAQALKAAIPHSIAFETVQWAIAHSELELVEAMAAADFRVLAWNFAEPNPAVHAAAAAGCARLAGHEDRWPAFATMRYAFGSLPFAALDTPALEFLQSLTARGVPLPWYTLEQLAAALPESYDALRATILGQAAAACDGAAQKRRIDHNMEHSAGDSSNAGAHRDELMHDVSLDDAPSGTRNSRHGGSAAPTDVFALITSDANRTHAFRAFVDHLANPLTAFAALRNADLRRAYTGGLNLRSRADAELFATEFRGDPAFVLQATRYLDTAVVFGMNATLAAYVTDDGVAANERAQALSIVKLTTASDARSTDLLLQLFAAVVPPRPELVESVSVGPFKVQVDPLEALREEAADGVAVALSAAEETPAVADDARLAEVLRLLAAHSLRDPHARTRLLAFRALRQAADGPRLRPMVLAAGKAVRAAADTELAAKPGKAGWQGDELRDVQLAAQELLLAMEE